MARTSFTGDGPDSSGTGGVSRGGYGPGSPMGAGALGDGGTGTGPANPAVGPAGPAGPGPAQPIDPNTNQSAWSAWLAQQRAQSRQGNWYSGADQNQDRDNQTNLIQQLQGLANGDPNSSAQQHLRGAYQASRAQQNALALSGREGTAGSRGMQATMNNGASQQGQAVDSRMLMLHEQAAAQAALAQAYAQQQSGDINNANNLAQSDLRGTALNDAMSQFYGQFDVNQQVGQYQNGANLTNAQYGYGLQNQQLNGQLGQMGAGAIGGAASTLSAYNWGGGGQQPTDPAALYNLSNNPYPTGSDPSQWSNPYGGG